MENWREIPGFPYYQVSDLGRVRSLRYLDPAGQPRVLKPMWSGGNNYPAVDLGGTNDKRAETGRTVCRKYIHELVLLAFVGPRPHPQTVARHANDVADDNRLENLSWGTKSQNQLDRWKNARAKLGKI